MMQHFTNVNRTRVLKLQSVAGDAGSSNLFFNNSGNIMIRYLVKISLLCLWIMAIKHGLIHEDGDDRENEIGRNSYTHEGTKKFTQMFGLFKQKFSELWHAGPLLGGECEIYNCTTAVKKERLRTQACFIGNNCTEKVERSFLRGPFRGVISRTSKWRKLVRWLMNH
jgi:hypothetical protein